MTPPGRADTPVVRMTDATGCPRCSHERVWLVAGARMELWAPSSADRGALVRNEMRCDLRICERCGLAEWTVDPRWLAASAADCGARLVPA